jgi:tyrosine-protein phosphatase YwqE
VLQIFKDIFKSKRKVQLDNLSAIGIDMHSHLIPGIDDGSISNEESLQMILALQDLGYTKLITTPHIMSGGYDNTTEIITSGRDKLAGFLKDKGVTLALERSSEYYLDGHFENLIKADDLMPFGNNYILFELSFMFRPTNIEKIAFELNMEGYRPILAHPERYNYLGDNNLKHFKKIKDAGVLFQLNLFSLSGAYGPNAKMLAEKLIKEQMIDFVGTDLHRPSQLHHFDDLLQNEHLFDLIQQNKLLNKQSL